MFEDIERLRQVLHLHQALGDSEDFPFRDTHRQYAYEIRAEIWHLEALARVAEPN